MNKKLSDKQLSMKDKSIRIDDWAGNLLFIGDYDDPRVDEVLDANRCGACDKSLHYEEYDLASDSWCPCSQCGGTGYSGDFEVNWVDEEDHEDMNVCEYINY